ncbi:CopG family ribbon-helix-helix protein [Alicyclobacillus fodiniaquatilis]|jgi:CopG family transcriptional regulator/antitoxin EndoAI|uniref:CopG family ribbon-helix-helix protein n=1 Tax=Alicyclobacillus fodiniaquatilis TaxID=1661150 RepID=A0ABW4JH26_9BACL
MISVTSAVEVPRVSGKKRMVVYVPEQLLEQVDGFAQTDCANRSQIVREALRMYVSSHRKNDIREQMQQGYQEMARLNLRIASESFPLEQEAGGTVERLVSGV